MAEVQLEPWPFTSQAGTLHAVPAGHSVNWLRSPLLSSSSSSSSFYLFWTKQHSIWQQVSNANEQDQQGSTSA